jgi:hypothetical protein
MPRAVLSPALVLSCVFVLGSSLVAVAGQQHSHKRHRPHVTAPARIVVGAPFVLVPLSVPTRQPRLTVGQAPETRSAVTMSGNPAPRRIVRPLSFEPLDPRATISRTASGRIFMGAPTGVYPYPESRRAQQPYAQPTFHMIGAPSGRHMGGDLKLTHGAAAPQGLETTPKVVWLSQPAPRKPRLQSAK